MGKERDTASGTPGTRGSGDGAMVSLPDTWPPARRGSKEGLALSAGSHDMTLQGWAWWAELSSLSSKDPEGLYCTFTFCCPLVLSEGHFRDVTHGYFLLLPFCPLKFWCCLLKAASVLHHTSTIKNRCPRVVKAAWEQWVGRDVMTKWPAQICIPSLPITAGKMQPLLPDTSPITFLLAFRGKSPSSPPLNASRSKWQLLLFFFYFFGCVVWHVGS